MTRKRKKQYKKGIKVKNYILWLLLLVSIVLLSLIVRKHHRAISYEIKKVYRSVVNKSNYKPPSKLDPTQALGVKVPRNFKVFGTDVSRHQGRINWEKLSKFRFDGHKIEFVFIKASEGENWEDNEFEYNWKKAKKYKILRGAYHFYRPKVHSSKQMKNFTELVKMEKGDLPPVLDVEIESSLPKSTYRKGVINCLKIMETTYGVKPIIYTNQKLYREYFKHKNFKGYRFWISRLKSTPPRMDAWHFWQFTYEAVVKGTDEYVDMNVFNGSKQQLLNMTKK